MESLFPKGAPVDMSCNCASSLIAIKSRVAKGGLSVSKPSWKGNILD